MKKVKVTDLWHEELVNLDGHWVTKTKMFTVLSNQNAYISCLILYCYIYTDTMYSLLELELYSTLLNS